MNQLQLVTFEQAKKLKELGFDWESRIYCGIDKVTTSGLYINHNKYPNLLTIPETALALKWLRDEKKIDIELTKRYTANMWAYNTNDRIVTSFPTFEQAESAGLDYALNSILKQTK